MLHTTSQEILQTVNGPLPPLPNRVSRKCVACRGGALWCGVARNRACMVCTVPVRHPGPACKHTKSPKQNKPHPPTTTHLPTPIRCHWHQYTRCIPHPNSRLYFYPHQLPLFHPITSPAALSRSRRVHRLTSPPLPLPSQPLPGPYAFSPTHQRHSRADPILFPINTVSPPPQIRILTHRVPSSR